jgi:hypothetical protein
MKRVALLARTNFVGTPRERSEGEPLKDARTGVRWQGWLWFRRGRFCRPDLHDDHRIGRDPAALGARGGYGEEALGFGAARARAAHS